MFCFAGPWPSKSSGLQCEIIVTFALPATSSKSNLDFGVVVNGGDAPESSGIYFFVDMAPTQQSAGPYTVTVGAMQNRSGTVFNTTDTLQLLPANVAGGDTSVELRVFVDNTVVEAYWQGGRVAMTIPLPTPAAPITMGGEAGADAYVASFGGAVDVTSASAWPVKSIWVDPGRVENGSW